MQGNRQPSLKYAYFVDGNGSAVRFDCGKQKVIPVENLPLTLENALEVIQWVARNKTSAKFDLGGTWVFPKSIIVTHRENGFAIQRCDGTETTEADENEAARLLQAECNKDLARYLVG